MLYCSHSLRRRCTAMDFKRWAFSCICGHFQQHFYCACTETAIYELLVKFLTPSFDSPTLISLQSVKFRRFVAVFHWFLHFISWKSAIFLLPVCLTYWPRKYATRVDPPAIISTKFEVHMTIHCRVIKFLLLIHCMTSWPWPLTFWPWTLLIHGSSCDQPCQKVRRSYAYPFLTYEL